MMMPRKKRKILIITLIVFLVLTICALLVTLYLTTDAFKSDETLFEKYVGQNFQNIGKFYNETEKSEYENLLNENKYTTDMEMKINYTENLGTTEEVTQNPINLLKLQIEGQTDKINNYDYKDIKLIKNTEKISEIKYARNDNIYGIEFSDLFNQYIAVKNENLKELFKKIGLTDEQVANIPSEINFDDGQYNIFDFTEEEKQEIQTRYINLLQKEISNSDFSKRENQNIEINGTKIITNAYILQLTKERLNNIYIKILEELKQDQIIISKLQNLEELLNEFKINISKEKSIEEIYAENIQYIIDEIAQSNIGQDIYKITVYENNGTTVKTTIQGSEYTITLDVLFSETEKYIQETYKEIETENEYSVILRKNNEQMGIVLKNIVEGNETEYSFINSDVVDGNNDTKNTVLKFEDSNNKIEISIETKYKIVQKFEEEHKFNETNSVNLSELPAEQTKMILDRASTAVSDKLAEIVASTVSQDDLKNLLIVSGLIKEGDVIEGKGVSETEKNRFNSKFEILKGENLNREAVLNLINAVKENLVNLDVVSDKQLKLVLDRTNKNEEMSRILSEFIEKNDKVTYNTTIEYDEQTGLISDILLTMNS